jgi:Spy/CpxP family protein refolding chaperone
MTVTRSTSLICFTLLAASVATAQGPTPPAPPAPPTTPAPITRTQSYDRGRIIADNVRDKIMIDRGSGGNMGIVPPGTWWKNPDTIAALSLTAAQQGKMDDILRQNRIALIDLKASLEKEEINLEPLLNANPVDSPKALLEISKIADLRAGLEKANAKMLLGLRAVLTADQWTKLQDQQHSRRRGPSGDEKDRGDWVKGPRGPVGPVGPKSVPPPPSTN